jgi:caspase domain-containing protein
MAGVLLAGTPARGQDTRKMVFMLGAEQNELLVTAEYYDPADLDQRLQGSRVLPVKMTLKNIAQKPVSFNYGDARLHVDGVGVLGPVDADVVQREIRRAGRVPGLLSFLAAQSSTYHRAALGDVRLHDGSLRPGQEKDGFVFFMLPERRADRRSNVMWLETRQYRPQMLETKGIRVFTKQPERKSVADTITAFWNSIVRGVRPPFNRSYALLIGIGKYQYWTPLSSPASDVNRMRDYLIAQGFDEVVAVEDDDVTLDRLRSPQTYFTSKILADDRFLFYYSGHGQSVPGTTGMKGYLPLVNEVRGGTRNSIPMDGLVGWMSALNAKHLLVILDACFSGLAVEGLEIKGTEVIAFDRDSLTRLAQAPARFLLMAGTAGQESIADRRWNGSLFTDAILRGLGAAAQPDRRGDRLITTRELYVWLKDTVSLEARKVQRELTPLLKDLGRNGVSEGEFVFVRK